MASTSNLPPSSRALHTGRFPKTILSQKMRRLFMAFLILLFFILSPAILLYTAGYRYNFTEKKVEQTGVISIDARPRNATVFLNETALKKGLPLRLPNRAPGTYHLAIEAPGKKTWEKDITVTSKQTTYIRNITLFADMLPVPLIHDEKNPIQSALFSESGKHAFLLTQSEEGTYTVELFTTQTETREPLVREKLEKAPALLWSPFSEAGAIVYQSGEGERIELVEPEAILTETKRTFDKAAGSSLTQWGGSEFFPLLYTQNGENLVSLSISEGQKVLEKRESPLWYVAEDGEIWYYDTESRRVVGRDRSFELQKPVEKIIHVNARRMIAKSDAGFLVLSFESGGVEEIAGDSFSYAKGTKEWLIATPWQLSSVYEDGTVELLSRTSDAIQHVAPLDAFGVLLLSTEHSLLAFNPGYYVTHTLFHGGTIQSVGVDAEARKIFFLGIVGSKHGVFALAY